MNKLGEFLVEACGFTITIFAVFALLGLWGALSARLVLHFWMHTI